MIASVAGALIALAYAYVRYVKKNHIPAADNEERPGLVSLSYHKFYVDEIYDWLIRKPMDGLSIFFYKVVDLLAIDGLVNGLGKISVRSSKGLRLLQSGNVGFYIFMMVAGIIAILIFSLVKI